MYNEDSEDSSPPPKRAHPNRGASTRGKRGQAAISQQSMPASSHEEPQPPVHAASAAPETPPPVASPASAPSIQQPPQEAPTSNRHLPSGQPSPQGAHPPDINTVIADIINHGETVESHCASQGYAAMGMVDTESYSQLGASLHLKLQSLPILDNLATQIINTLAKSSYQEILTIATKPDSDPGQAYATLKSLFDHTKKVYSITEPFLNPYELGLVENAHLDTIRKANMATFVSSVFGSQDVGFYHLNENFLDTFVADGGRLLKNQAQLLLDLKTQAYISAATTGERSREAILDDLFPHDLGDRLLRRRTGAKQLAPSEAEFVQRAQNRRKALLEEPNTEAAMAALPGKYIWEDFLRDISTYVSKNFEAIAGIAARKTPRPGRGSNVFTAEKSKQQPQSQQRLTLQQQQVPQQERHTRQMPQMQGEISLGGLPAPAETENLHIDPRISGNDDIAERAARAAPVAMQDFGNNEGSLTPQQPLQETQSSDETKTPGSVQPVMKGDLPQIQYHFEHPLHPNVPAPPPPHWTLTPYDHPQQAQGRTPVQQQWQGQGQMNMGQLHPSYSDPNLIPYPTQSAPTSVLYERARQAATAKSSPNNRRTGHPSQRRPWTIEEENSLMAGLDRVKGPHWSQILAMFGPGGTINEVLKDRNQVQLKDKARNLKLFFLKSGIEVPYYLQFVTGELKTRAPAQAAKNEAKVKSATSEDRAHVEGVLALAGGQLPESDQAATDREDQESAVQNGDIVMGDADGGHDSAMGNRTEADFGTANGQDVAGESADALRDDVGEIALLKQEKPEQHRTQQAQMLPTNVYMNGIDGRPNTLNLHTQAMHKPNLDSSNTDPALLV